MSIPEWKPSKAFFRWQNSVPFLKGETELDYWMFRDNDKLYIVFQATSGSDDWADNLNFFPIHFEPFPKVKVHGGFYKQYSSVRNKYLDELYKGIKEVFITGFSLGCAVTQIALYDGAWHNRRDNLSIQFHAIGFDGPRVFAPNKDIKHLCKDSLIHIKNRMDPVCHMPLLIMPTFFTFRWKPFKLIFNLKWFLIKKVTFWMNIGKSVKIGNFWPLPIKHLPEEIEKSLLKKYGE